VRFVDTGDVHLAPMTPPEAGHETIAARVREVVTAGLFPVVLGGDHSITFPVLQGLASARSSARPLHLVHFDTHMDYWDEIGGQRFTHASPIIRAHEAGLVAGITQYGIRGLHTAADNIELARSRDVVGFWCEQAKRESAVALVAHLEPGVDTWVTFDIDCLDPAIAPGTGTPEPGGFTYYEAKALLLAVAARVNVVGMDLVEVNPLYDPAQLAALHGARLILDLVGAAMRSRKGFPA
jgi:agmatinase